MSRFILVSENFQNAQFDEGIFFFFFLQVNVGGVNFLAMVNIIIHLFLSFVSLKKSHLSAFIHFFSLMSNKVHSLKFYPVQKYWSRQQFLNTLNNIYMNKFQSSVFLDEFILEVQKI